ncbi:MAG: heme-copper oxidase subunit III [Planctomycetes bacterium]|nr:heme-copper oxidase subunit III [Planctomycetota bacterium]
MTALSAIQKGNQKGLLLWLGLTILGGLTFVGLQAYEWTHLMHLGLLPSESNYAGTFYMLTGFHGLHVSIGVIYMSCIWWRAKQGAYTAEKNSPVELVGLYWHFVDLVWIVLFTIIYLIPDAVI